MTADAASPDPTPLTPLQRACISAATDLGFADKLDHTWAADKIFAAVEPVVSADIEGARSGALLWKEAANRAESTITTLKRAGGHNEPCYYCGKPCDSYAGNGALWPVALCHVDYPGRAKWHHTGCVSSRLEEITTLKASLDEAEKRADTAIDLFQHGREANDALAASALNWRTRAETSETELSASSRREEMLREALEDYALQSADDEGDGFFCDLCGSGATEKAEIKHRAECVLSIIPTTLTSEYLKAQGSAPEAQAAVRDPARELRRQNGTEYAHEKSATRTLGTVWGWEEWQRAVEHAAMLLEGGAANQEAQVGGSLERALQYRNAANYLRGYYVAKQAITRPAAAVSNAQRMENEFNIDHGGAV